MAEKDPKIARSPRDNDKRLQYVTDAFLYHVEGRYPSWEKYKEDMLLFVGDQWSEEDRAKLEKANKPALVFNHIQRQINLLTGYERTERRQIVAKPIGNEDVMKASVATASIRHVDRYSNADYEWTEAGENGLIVGEGIMGFPYDHREGRYKVKSESPFSHVPDRDCYDRTWSDSRIHFRFRWMSKKDIDEMFPKKKDEIDLIKPMIMYGWGDDPTKPKIDTQQGYDFYRTPADKTITARKKWSEFYDDKVRKWRVIECYEQQIRNSSVIMVKDEDGTESVHAEVPYTIDENGEIVEDVTTIATVVGEMKDYRLDKKRLYRWRLTVFAGDVLLDDGFTRFARNPFVPLFAYLKYDGEKLRIWGWVRKLADPQMVYNKIKSQLLHMLNKSAGNVIFMTSNLLKGVGVDRVQEALQGFNEVIEVSADKIVEGEGFVQMKPNTPPSEYFTMLEEGKMELLEIGDIDGQAMLGMSTKGDPSGWALELKQKQGAIKIATPFDNFRESRRIFYSELVWPMVRQSGLKSRIRRELIPNLPSEVQGASLPINMKPSEMTPEELAMLASVLPPEDMDELIALDEVYNPLTDLDVDIVFDDTEMSDTERNRTLTMLANMAQTYGPEVIPIELLMEFTDNPVRNKILTHLQQMRESQQQQEPGGAPE